MVVEVQARRLPSLQFESVFQQFWNVKPLDIYREAWGQFPAEFVMKKTNKQKQVFLMRPQDFSSCVWWHEEVFLMRPQDFSSCACVVTKIGILTQNKTFFLTLTKWLWCLNLPRSKRKWNTRGFKHSRWIHKRKLHLLFLSWFKWFDAQNGGKTTSVSGPPFQGLVPFYYIAFNI